MTIEVDPYEALVKLALSDGALSSVVENRIDVWHKYGQDAGDWSLTASSLIFSPIGGELNVDDDVARPRIEARCYADTPFGCGEIWRRLVDFTTGANKRRTVTVTEGTALVYFVLPLANEGMPRLVFDEEVRPGGGMPFYLVNLHAEISLLTVT